jgi:hypothetical protein
MVVTTCSSTSLVPFSTSYTKKKKSILEGNSLNLHEKSHLFEFGAENRLQLAHDGVKVLRQDGFRTVFAEVDQSSA